MKISYRLIGIAVWAMAQAWCGVRAQSTGESVVATTVELPATGANGEEIVPLSTLDVSLCTNGYGTIQRNKSIDNNPIRLKGVTYSSGIGCHATAKMIVKLNGAVTRFHATIGIDDEVSLDMTSWGSVEYVATLLRQNGKETVASTGEIRRSDTEAVDIDIENLSEYKYLVLEFNEGANNYGDHVDVANAYFEYVEQNSSRPEMVDERSISTGLDCATTMFSQPGVRYMHKLRSNNPEVTIGVKNLPAGLTFNEKRCLVEGVINVEGEYGYTAVVTEGTEVTEIPVTLTVSSKLPLPVPFMGWLSWNVVESEISQDVVETVADAFISQGLYDAGYNYLVLDDNWHNSKRADDGKPLPSPAKFPAGIKAAADYVHAKGLRFGIYSDAAERTCAGEYGSYGYEEIDARQYAEWEVDLLKYDYCHAPADVRTARQRYTAMGNALKNSGRDILFYICEWGVREPWKWGSEAGGHCWRTTYDTRDGWKGVNGGIGMIQSIEGMKDLWAYSGVNRFNDADMMCVGIHGNGKSSNDYVETIGMTQDEYRTQFALWCMWSSPLSLSFDLRKPISDDDLAIMTNPELIAIDQDRMGQQAEFMGEDENRCQLYVKDLENGDVAVAVVNLSNTRKSYTIDFSKIAALDPAATYSVRDVQTRTDLADARGSIAVDNIARHATIVYRLHNKTNDPQAGITKVLTEALGNMTASVAGDSINVCIAGTKGADKRVLVSDIEGRVVASASGSAECFSFKPAVKMPIYVINATCAGRSHTIKVKD